MENGSEKVLTDLEAAFAATGVYINTAAHELATELGGEKLSERVTELSGDGLLPDPAVLELLEQIKPGAANEVMTRSKEIQEEESQRELEELRKPSFKRYGRALVKGMASLSIFPDRR